MPDTPTKIPEDLIGTRVGNYQVVRALGRGGMGTVYAAVHEQIGQQVAIKVLHPHVACHPDAARRFLTEARAVNLVRHPGLVRTQDLGQLPGGQMFLVMEYLEGESLHTRLRRHPLGMPVGEALRLVRQIASALEAAHEAGIVHRDLKPANIFLIPEAELPGGERVKVLDFGVAKILYGTDEEASTDRDAILGTPAYMAPEQCRGAGGVSDRADVYSLGVILYQLLAGRPPFSGAARGELMAMHIYKIPPALADLAPALPESITHLVHAMLTKDPVRRPAMAEVSSRLAALAAEAGPEVGTGPVTGRPLVEWVRSRWQRALGVAALLGLCATGLLLHRLLRREPVHAPTPAAFNRPIAEPLVISPPAPAAVPVLQPVPAFPAKPAPTLPSEKPRPARRAAHRAQSEDFDVRPIH